MTSKRCVHCSSSLQRFSTRCPVCHPLPLGWLLFIVNIPRWYLQALAKSFVFNGRACCRELWSFTIINTWISYSLFYLFHQNISSPLVIFMLLILLPSLTVTLRRLHDLNLRAWWLLPWIAAPLLLLAGAFVLEDIMYPPPEIIDAETEDSRFINFPAMTIIFIWPLLFMVFMMFLSLPGMLKNNRFGPDPRESANTPKAA